MNPDNVPLGGQWDESGGREYAPGLVGRVYDEDEKRITVTLVARGLRPEALPDTLFVESAYPLDPGARAVYKADAESACDHAARVFLAGCCEYAEWVRIAQAEAMPRRPEMDSRVPDVYPGCWRRRYSPTLIGNIRESDSGIVWSLMRQSNPWAGGFAEIAGDIADNLALAQTACDAAAEREGR